MARMHPARVAAFLLFSSAVALAAQPSLLVHLRILVTDASGAVIPNALIDMRASSNDGGHASANTDARGEGVFNLVPGTYKLSVAAPGFAQLERDGIKVSGDSIQAI